MPRNRTSDEPVFLAYLPTGELITRPSPNLDYIKSVARQHFLFHADDIVKVYAVSDAGPTFECNIRRQGNVIMESVAAAAARRRGRLVECESGESHY